MKINPEKFRAKIIERGFNNQTFANQIGVNRGTISNILGGKTSPSLIIVQACCCELNLTAEESFIIFMQPGKKNHEEKNLKIL